MSVSAPNTCTEDQLDEVIVSSMASAGDSSPINNVTDDSIEEENLGEYKENYVPPHSIGSNSCLTEVTDQGEEEDGVGFDMSNRHCYRAPLSSSVSTHSCASSTLNDEYRESYNTSKH
uniref:Uncharacterized protein n=1 Tax=Cacopsylla melanoneura TaxID=428564 RepID=A0A8D8R468_9HEMI